MDFNKLIARVKAILLTPKTEWPVIASEPTTVGDLYKGYIVWLAAVPAIIGLLVTLSFGFVGSIPAAIVRYLLTLGMFYVFAMIVDALAPTFGGQKNIVQALKVVAYSLTAASVASIGTLVPLLGLLIMLAGLAYGIYLLYLGLPHTMQCPPEKAGTYTVVIVVVGVVIGAILSSIFFRVTGGYGSGASMYRMSRDGGDSQFEKDSALGKMEQWSKSVEKASKGLEAAQKSGSQEAQAAAMKTMMGAALGGGTVVESLAPDRLKPFIPETFAGMPRTKFAAERNNAMGMQISEARATYENESGRSVDLEITDTGTAKGLLGLAAWAGIEGEKQTDSGYEKTYRDNGRLIHEEWKGDHGEYTVVLADRFTVSVRGSGDNIDQLKGAVQDLDLSGLEDLKGEGVKQ